MQRVIGFKLVKNRSELSIQVDFILVDALFCSVLCNLQQDIVAKLDTKPFLLNRERPGGGAEGLKGGYRSTF